MSTGARAGNASSGRGGNAGRARGGTPNEAGQAGMPAPGEAGTGGVELGGRGGTTTATGGTGTHGGRAGAANGGGGAKASGGADELGGAGAGEAGDASGGDAAGRGGTGGLAGTGGTGIVCPASGGAGAGNSSGANPSCTDASDCDHAIGERACGAWACQDGACTVETRCTDADGDGFWTGPDCACSGRALDCDDGDETVGDSTSVSCCNGGTRACTSGVWGLCSGATGESCNGEDDDCNGTPDDLPVITCGLGACRATIQSCVNGTLTSCKPNSPATTVDDCNGIDDDCDGAVDEDCPVCIHVAPNGNDTTARACNGALPFASVQAALDFADVHREVARRVCVAAGPSCGSTATYDGPTSQDLTMHEGISLLGNYESTGWTRCEDATTSTHLAPRTGHGVLFPPGIALATGLDGFAIDRTLASAVVAGVTVDGARGVMLSNLQIVGSARGPSGSTTAEAYGVNVVNGGDATVARSIIEGAYASHSSAVRAVGSRLTLEQNAPPNAYCTTLNGGEGSAGPRIGSGSILSTTQSTAVELVDSPGSRIGTSILCANAESPPQSVSALTISGRADGIVVNDDIISGFGVAGVLLNDCDDGAPWLVDTGVGINFDQGHFPSSDTPALRVTGACHPVIEAGSAGISFSYNSLPVGSGGFGSPVGTAIDCGDGTVPSRCVITNNDVTGLHFYDVEPLPSGTSPAGTAINCRSGSCARIDGNVIDGISVSVESSGGGSPCGSCSADGTGLVLGGAATSVRGNDIAGATRFGDANPPNGSLPTSATSVSGRTTANIDDNHLRDLFEGSATEFERNVSGGVSWTHSGGVVSDNCAAYFYEANTSADPAVFQDNDLYGANGGTIYRDEGSTDLTTAAEVDALTDMTVSGTTDTACTTPPVTASITPAR